MIGPLQKPSERDPAGGTLPAGFFIFTPRPSRHLGFLIQRGSIDASQPSWREGSPVPREPGYGSKRRQDAEAQRTCREPRPGGPRRTSGDGAWAAPSGAANSSGDPRRLKTCGHLRTCGHFRASAGLPMPREPGYGSKRRQDAEAQRTCRERMPRWHPRTSGDGHGQPLAAAPPRAPQVENLRPLPAGRGSHR